jgi:hypothetical protein
MIICLFLLHRKTRGRGAMIHKLGQYGLVQFLGVGLKGLGVMGLAQTIANPPQMVPLIIIVGKRIIEDTH